MAEIGRYREIWERPVADRIFNKGNQGVIFRNRKCLAFASLTDAHFSPSGCEASALKILTSMSLSIVASLFGMTGGLKFTFIWSKLLHFPMLVILQVAQAPTVSLRKCAIFFTLRNS